MSKFQPKKGQQYWMINSRFIIVQATHSGGARSANRINNGNAFRTEGEAATALSILRNGEADLGVLSGAIEMSVISGKIQILEDICSAEGGAIGARRLIQQYLTKLRKEHTVAATLMKGAKYE